MRTAIETSADSNPIAEIATIFARAILRLRARNALLNSESSSGDNSEKSLAKGLEAPAKTVLSGSRG